MLAVTPPPTDDLVRTLQTLIVPALAGGAFGAVLFLAVSRRLAWPAAVAGVLGGVAFANWSSNQSYFPFALGERSYERLFPASALVTLAGLVTAPLTLLTARAALVAAWLVRAIAMTFAMIWLAGPWPDRLALAGLALLQWATLDLAARPHPDRVGLRSAQLLLIQSLTLFAAGGLVLYAHSLRLSDALTLAAASVLGVTLAAYSARADVRLAFPFGSVLLVGVLFIAHETTTSEVPVASYWLAATAPLALLPWVHPRLVKRDGWAGYLLRFAVALIPVGVALYLASQVELLPWEEDW